MIRHPIAVINQSSVVSDAEGKAMAEAFSIQANRDFGPIWGTAAIVSYVPKGHQPPPGKWWLVLVDNSDQAGALGYHDLTPEGNPIGKLFAKTDQQYGSAVSVTLSHEGLEMLGDPYIDLTVQAPGENGFYAYENCDACEDDQFAYTIEAGGQHVKMSDFVYPRYFDVSAAGKAGVQFDRQNHITEPFQLLPGGYMSLWTPGKGWTQVQAAQPSPGDRPRVGSRRERRRTPKAQWLLSDIHTSYGDHTPLGLLPVEEEVISHE